LPRVTTNSTRIRCLTHERDEAGFGINLRACQFLEEWARLVQADGTLWRLVFSPAAQDSRTHGWQRAEVSLIGYRAEQMTHRDASDIPPHAELQRVSGVSTHDRAGSYPFNDEFTSSNPEDVTRFYDHFRSRDELVAWMRSRPMGRAVISEVEGKTDAVVVIPTADVSGPLAANCRDMLFKGQHIIFVESGRSDPFFNYARNINVGCRRALEHNPKWIIVANDDSLRVDSISTLTSGLEKIDPDETTIAYPVPFSNYHSVESSLVHLKNWAYPLLRFKRAELRRTYDLSRRLGVKFRFMSNWIFTAGSRRLLYGPFVRAVASYVDPVSFGVYSSRLIRDLGGKLYDEVYINSGEESDLAFKTWTGGKGIRYVPFRVGDQVGMTLGTGLARTFRSLASGAYLNYKVEHGLLEIPHIGSGDRG
jgi:hypothetical protein